MPLWQRHHPHTRRPSSYIISFVQAAAKAISKESAHPPPRRSGIHLLFCMKRLREPLVHIFTPTSTLPFLHHPYSDTICQPSDSRLGVSKARTMARRSARLSTKMAPSPTPTTTTTASKPPPRPRTPTAKVMKRDPETITFSSPTDFDAWLLANGTCTPWGIWLKIAKKASCIPSVSYDEAIDSALCHGWIDGQRKAHDDNYFLQRFTPRRRNSLWSKRNVDKVGALTAKGRMHDTGMAEVDAARADGRWDRAYAGPATMQVPDDFAAALKMNQRASDAFEGLGKSARFPFLWRVTTAKTEEARRRKIETLVDMLARGETLT